MAAPKTLFAYGKAGQRKVESDPWEALVKKPPTTAAPTSAAPFKPVMSSGLSAAAQQSASTAVSVVPKRFSPVSLLVAKPLRY